MRRNHLATAASLPRYRGVQPYKKVGTGNVMLRWHQKHWLIVDLGPNEDNFSNLETRW